MLAGQIIFAILSVDETVGPLVSDDNSEDTYRIFPIRTPISADQLPLIAYTGENNDPVYVLGGLDSLIKQTVQIACLADNYDDATALENAVVNAMNVPIRVLYGDIVTNGIFYRGRSEEELLLPKMGEDVTTYANTLTYDIWYVRPSILQAVSPFSFGFSGGYE